MKYILMKSSGGFKRVVPVEKSKRNINRIAKEAEEAKPKEEEEKLVDVAEYDIKDDDFSRELKKGTDKVLKGYLKADPAIPVTYIGFDRDINAVIQETMDNQDLKNKKEKKEERSKKIKSLKNKLLRRRDNG